MPAARSPRVRLDPFVAAVRKDPGDTEPLCVVTGFVGRSPTEGKLRIYADAGLSHWVEAAEADVVHSVPIDNSPLGGSHLWLKASAPLTPGSVAAGAGPPGGAWFTQHFCAAPAVLGAASPGAILPTAICMFPYPSPISPMPSPIFPGPRPTASGCSIVCPPSVSGACIPQPTPTCAPMYCMTPPPSATMPCMISPGGGS
jgi:hypothetical protein